jgi:hypoxanthine-DNA glycosylase
MEAVKRSFPPVVDAATRLLILGSLPGEESLSRRQYYANPRNQFWPLMEAVTERRLVDLAYETRLEALLASGVGLWDTVEAATRKGSLDGAIRDPRANDLAALADRLPALRAVGFNGARSAGIGLAQLAGRDLALVPLPSSSPAFTLPFAAKLERWMALKPFLG